MKFPSYGDIYIINPDLTHPTPESLQYVIYERTSHTGMCTFHYYQPPHDDQPQMDTRSVFQVGVERLNALLETGSWSPSGADPDTLTSHLEHVAALTARSSSQE